MSFRSLVRCGVTAFVLAVSFVGSAEADTLPDVLVKAYGFNPTLKIGQAQLRQADERVVQARSALLPDVTAVSSVSLEGARDVYRTSENQRLGTSATFSAQLQSEIILVSGGRVSAQIASSISSVMSARSRLTSIEQDVLLEAVTAYMDVRRDIQFVDLARNNIRVLTEQLRATQDRFDVGEVTKTDVSQAEAALAAARANLARNVGSLAQSRSRFVAAVGEEPVDLAPPPPVPDLPKSRDEAEAVSIRQHPSLTSARFNEEASQHDVDVARAGVMPQVTLEGSVFFNRVEGISSTAEVADDDDLGARITLNLQVPLYRGGELSSLIRQALEVVEQRKAETQDTARSIRNAVRNAWSGLEVARATIRANREQIKAQEIAFAGVVEEAKVGERTTLDVLDAEQALLQARSDLVSAVRDEYVAAYNLLSAMGLLTVNHLGLKVEPFDPEANYNTVSQRPATPEGPVLEEILDRWGD